MLKDPTVPSNRAKITRSYTIETSGKFISQETVKTASQSALLPSIKIIESDELITYESSKCLGEGRFGKCFLKVFSHFKVCVKQMKLSCNNAFIKEANILSRFQHANLPYLFGVCLGDNPALVTSFHGCDDACVTLHDAVASKTKIISLDNSSSWINILYQITNGLHYIHNKCKIIHNDIKSDNICLTSSITTNLCVQAVIIDFGKACDANKGKTYTLSENQKEQYKKDHPHIASDLRDGASQQSALSDVFGLGRMIKLVNSVPQLQREDLEELSNMCMRYHMHSRPKVSKILQHFNEM